MARIPSSLLPCKELKQRCAISRLFSLLYSLLTRCSFASPTHITSLSALSPPPAGTLMSTYKGNGGGAMGFVLFR